MKKRTIRNPNEIIINGDVAEIVLYDKDCKEVARTIIDAEDVAKVKKYKWYLAKGYVVTNLYRANQKRQSVGIQHVILGITPNRKHMIDHRNRNPLINRKYNLRVCSNENNCRNSGKPKNNTSGFKGVSVNGKGWQSRIKINRKEVHLGTFKDITDAARAYNIAALKHHGEFACLNKGV